MPYNLTDEDLASLSVEQLLQLSDANIKMSRRLDGEMVRRGLVTAGRTPFQADRERAERTWVWPKSWGPFHRHFGSDAVHRDGSPECDQPGTPRRVFVFDGEYLDEHERYVAAWAVQRFRDLVPEDLEIGRPGADAALLTRIRDLLWEDANAAHGG